MKWLKRGWLLAWCVWVWLGIGLYRELPRELGPVVCTLAFGAGDQAITFLPDGTGVVTFHLGQGSSTTSVYNVPTGERRFRVKGPDVLSVFSLNSVVYGSNSNNARRFGMLVAPEGPELFGRTKKALHVLNLSVGEWRQLTKDPVEIIAYHDRRPWVLYKERDPAGIRRERYVVHDFQADARRWTHYPPAPWSPACKPFFIPGEDRVVIPVKKVDDLTNDSAPGAFEIWTLTERPTSEMIQPAHVLVEATVTPSRSGLASFFGGINRNWHAVDVVDITSGQLIRSFNAEYSGLRSIGDFDAFVTPNGNAIFGGLPATLRRIHDGTTLWKNPGKERPFPFPALGKFFIREPWGDTVQQWTGGWIKLGPSLDTYAWRDLDTGRLVERITAEDFRFPYLVNAEQTLVVSEHGVVQEMPYRVRWRLFFLCQTILALPLLSVWAILRWRRRRVVPSQTT